MVRIYLKLKGKYEATYAGFNILFSFPFKYLQLCFRKQKRMQKEKKNWKTCDVCTRI